MPPSIEQSVLSSAVVLLSVYLCMCNNIIISYIVVSNCMFILCHLFIVTYRWGVV